MVGRHRTGWKAAAAAVGAAALLAAGPTAWADGTGARAGGAATGGVAGGGAAVVSAPAPAAGTAGTSAGAPPADASGSGRAAAGDGTRTATSHTAGDRNATGSGGAAGTRSGSGDAADAGTGTVDAVAGLEADATLVAPGRRFHFTRAAVTLASGSLAAPPAWTLTIPPGATYVTPEPNNVQSQFCTLAASGRSLHCGGVGPDTFSIWYPAFTVDQDTPLGTLLPFTLTADIGTAVDTHPGDNTASLTVTVGTGTDWGLKWQAPDKPVQPGTVVHTVLVVTNHGPGASTNDVHISFPDDGSYPDGTTLVHSPRYPACAGDSGVIDCYLDSPVAAGTSVSFVFDWVFPASARGRELRLPTGFFSADAADGNPSNDRDTLVVRIAKAAPPTAPGKGAGPGSGSGSGSGGSTATPPSGAGANAPAPQGGTLAATGSSAGGLIAGAAGALAAGAALTVLGRRRAAGPGRHG